MLFLIFEVKIGSSMGLIQVMCMEYVQMCFLFDDVVDVLELGNFDDYFGQVEILLIMMQQYNMKEENIFYLMCDEQLLVELLVIFECFEIEFFEK